MKAYCMWLRAIGWTIVLSTLTMCLYVAYYQPIQRVWVVIGH